jgi:formate hydrogenlyase subunit 3/multisubunit Na+/H+ antiporter MnhD subunit
MQSSPSVEKFMLTILAILIIIIFGWCIYAFFFAIYEFIFSWGDQAKIKSAWNSIRYMILGVIMTVVFLFVFPVLFKKLNIPKAEQYNAQNIFKTAGNLIYGIFGFAGDAIDTYKQGEYAPGVNFEGNSSVWWSQWVPAPNPKDFEL